MTIIHKILTNRKTYLISIFLFMLIFGIVYYYRTQLIKEDIKPIIGANGSNDQAINTLAGTFANLFIHFDMANNSKKDIITHYCVELNSIFDTNKSLNYNLYEYNANKSIFVYNLCQYAQEGLGIDKYDEKLKEYAKDQGYKNLRTMNKKGECDPDINEMRTCRIGEDIAGIIFRELMNEYSNIKLASIFGVAKNSTEEIAKLYSNTYFGQVCGDNKFYIYNENIDDNERFCSHPLTYKILAGNIGSMKKLLVSTKYLDGQKMLEIGETDKSNYFQTGFQNKTLNMRGFQKVIMNEFFFYKLFITYYKINIEYNNTIGPIEISQDLESTLLKNKRYEIGALEKELIISENAIYHMFRIIRNISAVYPIHIGLMAYYEDILNLRKEFVKVYTPIHAMYSRFRRVQDERR